MLGSTMRIPHQEASHDALSLTEFELMELLDVGLAQVKSALALISEMTSPRYQTVLVYIAQLYVMHYPILSVAWFKKARLGAWRPKVCDIRRTVYKRRR
ncbi:putative DNA repair protein RAD51 2 [Helianthus anomalus]